MPHDGLDDVHRYAVRETGNQRCSDRANALPLGSDGVRHSSWLVIAGVDQLCCVLVPVTAGVADPADGGGRV